MTHSTYVTEVQMTVNMKENKIKDITADSLEHRAPKKASRMKITNRNSTKEVTKRKKRKSEKEYIT